MTNSKRNYANFDIVGNYEVKKAAPLDNRMCTPYKSDLISNSWVTYKGMLCEVTDDSENNGLYELTDKDSKTISNWRKITSYKPSEQLLDENYALYNIVQGVGGFDSSSGWGPSYLKDFTYDQLFDILLFPLQMSIKYNPIVNVTISPSGSTYDVDESFFNVDEDVTFTMNVNITGNKVTLVEYNLTNQYTGDISSAYYRDFNGLIHDLSFDNQNIEDINFTHTILPGDQSLNVYVTYYDGSFQPYNSKGLIDTSSTDLTNNNNNYRGPSGEYLSQTHIGSIFITGIYPVFKSHYNPNDITELLPEYGNYRYTDNIEFQVNMNVETDNPLRFAISKLRFDELSYNNYNIKFEEDINPPLGSFDTIGCKFYRSNNNSYTLYDLSYDNVDININGIGDVSYVAFSTQSVNNFGSRVVPITFRFTVE